jgi:hypothetical protein
MLRPFNESPVDRRAVEAIKTATLAALAEFETAVMVTGLLEAVADRIGAHANTEDGIAFAAERLSALLHREIMRQASPPLAPT